MAERFIKGVTLGIPVLISILFFLLIVKRRNVFGAIYKSKTVNELILMSFEKIYGGAISKTSDIIKTSVFLNRFRKYKDRENFLKETGLFYMLGRSIKPEEYIFAKAVVALFCGTIGLSAGNGFFKIIYSFTGSLLGYFLFDFILIISNEQDNKKILPDIRALYDMLRIKAESGVYIGNAISETYLVVENPRLKKALYELRMEMIVEEPQRAIENLNSKFKNVYIDTMCMVFSQVFESGKIMEIIESVEGQMSDCERSINENTKNMLELRVMSVLIVVYGLIILFVIYILAFSLDKMIL